MQYRNWSSGQSWSSSSDLTFGVDATWLTKKWSSRLTHSSMDSTSRLYMTWHIPSRSFAWIVRTFRVMKILRCKSNASANQKKWRKDIHRQRKSAFPRRCDERASQRRHSDQKAVLSPRFLPFLYRCPKFGQCRRQSSGLFSWRRRNLGDDMRTRVERSLHLEVHEGDIYFLSWLEVRMKDTAHGRRNEPAHETSVQQ